MAIREITTGQDSFLDIVANLVGVLIILVVVVGAQATSAWEPAEADKKLLVDVDEKHRALDVSAETVTRLRSDNKSLEIKIRNESLLASDASDKRHRAMLRLEVVRREIENQRAELSAEQQSQFDGARQLAELQAELDEIQREAIAVTVSVPRNEVLNHYPTPIAKTVFHNEVHFRLSGGKLAYVPVDELMERVKSEWKVKAKKLARASQTIETVGPIDGFRLRYQIGTQMLQDRSGAGRPPRQITGVGSVVMLPINERMGESVPTAISQNSVFQAVLSRFSPAKTTVTVWVYPDSFREYNLLKDWLHDRSFRVASRPREPNGSIGFSPNGSATEAQ